ncbi:60S ribosomal protein L24B [Coccomyxa viridis]|uniref:60S ribosomal protein L24B n=1 Tax=Coccomyxa viridis TaxID=1274662 RepID=A0AAV1I8Q3_9CHLO|nr:60S ribosomal protein L24B [Coccomyxa viridis]
MVLKTTTCRFSGLRIYPGRGILFVRTDGQQYLFINRKTKSLFGQRKRPAKIAWTTVYRKQHKKDQEAQIARKKRRATTRTQARSIAGTSLEVINKRRAEKPEVRKASREAALREVKERLKSSKQEKAALRSADAKRGGGKAAKSVPGARAPGAKSGTRR